MSPPFDHMTVAERDELERRADDDDAHPDDVVPWEEVKAAAQARWAADPSAARVSSPRRGVRELPGVERAERADPLDRPRSHPP